MKMRLLNRLPTQAVINWRPSRILSYTLTPKDMMELRGFGLFRDTLWVAFAKAQTLAAALRMFVELKVEDC